MDSTMMWMVNHAMNNAHEKMKSKEGVLERLNGISKFYELAVMQLDGCLKFVRQETDSYILESSHEQLLEDLTEIRNRLQGRVIECEMAIKEKDRELVSLQANIKPDNGDSDSEFCELKNSVDQQVWNIRQKLEPDYEFKDKEGNPEVVEGINNKKIELMGSDIGILKETLDLAFGKMQSAIFSSEVGPMEQQWRRTIEKDTVSTLLKGFMRDFQEDVEAQVWKQEKLVSLGLMEYWSDLMNEVADLRHELESFVDQNEVQVKSNDSFQANLGCKIPNKANEKHSPEDFSHRKPEKQQSLRTEEVMQVLHEEETEEEGGNYVSKMIKNHESIIRRKSVEAEELNLLKREILRQKGSLASRREEIGMQESNLKRRIQEIILRLDQLRDWDDRLGETFGNYEFLHEEGTPSEKRFLKSDANHDENLKLDTLADVWEKMDKAPYAANEELQNEVRMLKQEQEEENLKAVIMENTYVALLEGLIKENYIELHNYELESLMWKDICQVLLTEVINQWKENIESNNFESQTREEIYCTVLGEAIKDSGSTSNFLLAECQNLRAENNSLEESAFIDKLCYLEGTIREDICLILLHEMLKHWNKCVDGYETESLIRQEIDRLVFNETIKDFVNTASYSLAQYQDIVTREFLQSTESSVKEDIYMVFVRETIKDWKMELNAFTSYSSAQYEEIVTREFLQSTESFFKEDIYMFFIRETIKEWKMELNAFKMENLFREEIYQFVIVEAVKDAFILFREAESENQDKFSKGMLSANKLHHGRQVSAEENLNEKVDSLLSCLEVEEDLMVSASFEMKELDAQLDLVVLECEESNERDISKELLTKGHTFSSERSKLEKPLQQLIMNEALVGQLGSSLGTVVGDSEKVCNQMTPAVGSINYRELSYCQPNANKEMESNPSDSMFTLVLRFSEVLVDFEQTTKEKLQMNFLRLDEMKHHLDMLVELVSSLREKESLYKDAFIRRCQNLRKAETEVDLLGDQVDVLVALLEKIYKTLYHHSPVLQQYFEVSDILQSIKKELIGVVNASKN